MVEFEINDALDKLPENYRNSIELSITEFELDKLVAVEPSLPPLVYEVANGGWLDVIITDVQYDMLSERYFSVGLTNS